jgi:hypothetical protein
MCLFFDIIDSKIINIFALKLKTFSYFFFWVLVGNNMKICFSQNNNLSNLTIGLSHSIILHRKIYFAGSSINANFSFSNCQNFPFQTVKISKLSKFSFFKLSKFSFSNCQNFQTVKISPLKTVKNAT